MKIKDWSIQKKVFGGLASATILIGLSWLVSKIIDVNKSSSPKNKK